MNARENFRAMMNGKSPERLPFQIDLTPPVLETLRAALRTEDPRDALGSEFVMHFADFGETPGKWEEAYADLGIHLDDDCEVQRLGITVRYPRNRGKAYHLAQFVHPLSGVETVRQLENLPWPDPGDPRHYLDVQARLSEVKKLGKVNVLGMACTLFEDSWYLRGMEELMEDLIEGNPVGEWLLDYMTERSVSVVQAYAQAGVDVVLLGDDIGMQESMLVAPDFWRRHLKPRLARVIRAVRESATGETWIMYHSDGKIEPVIAELFEMGVDILNPVQPECLDVPAILRRYGDTGAFWGMIGTQTTMPHGRPDDVRQAVAQLVELAEEGIRLVCAPTHVIEPDVPMDNLIALVNACRHLKPSD
jgi:uroporphyrinogen decarboxylase